MIVGNRRTARSLMPGDAVGSRGAGACLKRWFGAGPIGGLPSWCDGMPVLRADVGKATWHDIKVCMMNANDPSHLTEELLKRLLASDGVESYLDEERIADRELVDYLRTLLHEHGLKRAGVARTAGLNATVVYDIFAGKSRPGRDHAIMLAFGLECDLHETQRLLRFAGVSELWCRQRRDAIIIWCINQGFDRVATDDELYRLHEPTLLSVD